MNIKHILISISLLLSNIALADSNQHIDNYSRQLLDVMKWDQRYEQDRKQDTDYLLGTIDGPIIKHLTVEQKNELMTLMRAAIFNRMMVDKDTFKNALMEQYNKFFTIDELKNLIKYYKTDIMQFIIQAQLDKAKLSTEQINHHLRNLKNSDQEILNQYNGSYLKARYKRFQEKVNPQISQMIATRLKEVIDTAVKDIPNILKTM